MAYGLKYTLTFRDLLNANGTDYSNVWIVNIYANGYGGSSTAFKADDKPITLNYKKQDVFSPIIGSELTVNMLAESVGQYDEFINAAPLAYYVDILKNGSTWWSGVNTTDNFTQPYSNAPYKLSLKFNCGLGELQWRRYENAGNLYVSFEQVVQIISNCLSFLPYNKTLRTLISIREDNMDDTKGLLEQLYLSDQVFTEVADDGVVHGIPCLTVLQNICTALNCRMYQSNNMWFIERIYERVNTSIIYFDYTMQATPQTGNSFTYAAHGTLSLVKAIDNTSLPRMLSDSEEAATQKFNGINYKFNSGGVDNIQLIPNAFFEDNPTAKSSKGLPLRWDFATTYTDEKIEIVDAYETDLKYRTGLSWGTQAQAAQSTYFSSNKLTVGLNRTNASTYDQYGIHAVQRAGDSFTRQWLYLDPLNGSLQINIRNFVRIRFTRTSTGIIGTDYQNPVLNMMMWFYQQYKLSVQDGSGNNYYLYGNHFLSGWTKDNTNSWYGNLLYHTQYLFGSFQFQIDTYQRLSGQPIGLIMNQLFNRMNATPNGSYFDVCFWMDETMNTGFDTSVLGTSAGIYKFDFKMLPPLPFPYTGANTTTPHFSLSIADFANDALDIQYKDSLQSTVSFQNFYSTSDLSNRWGEKQIPVIYGDTLTPGYPGSFRLSSAAPTSAWHNLGLDYYFNSTTISNANPGSGSFAFNNGTFSSITAIYISDNDAFSQPQAAKFAALQVGQSISMRDIYPAPGDGFSRFTVSGTPIHHGGYTEIPVTYVGSSGSWANTPTSDNIVVSLNSNQLLADILYSNAIQIIGQYRRNFKAKIIGAVDFWQTYSVTDTATRYCIQTGAVYDIKNGQISADIEEMSDAALTISKFGGSTTLPIILSSGGKVITVSTGPIHTTTTTPVSKVTSIVTVTTPSYPI